MNRAIVALGLMSVSLSAWATTCQPLYHQSGEIIPISSARYLGGRVQLPSNLIAKPTVSNPHLWDVDGLEGTNQILIKPNSDQPEGKSTMIFAFTEDGQVFDILATRTKAKSNQACVLVNDDSSLMSKEQKAKISAFMTQKQEAAMPDRSRQTIARLRKELAATTKEAKETQAKAVVDALRKYRYRIYTRYVWDDGDQFIGRDAISDVYDDGQFTYLRLSNPNRGVLSVETEIGGKAAIAPTKYDDAYGIYKITGIYPSFRLRIDDITVEVQRTDNVTRSNI
ncbi:hypothetical protein AB4391_01530 [Vibrio lentus]|nr:hypothetical protein [Vibrio lentus]